MNAPGSASASRSLLDRLNSDRAFRLMLWFFGALLLVYAAIPVANALLPGKSVKDYELWYDTGQHVLRGEAIYPPAFHKFPFMYPPAAALFLAPISLLGQTGVVVVLVLVNAAAWIASVVLSVRLVTGQWTRQHPLLYAIPSALIAVYAWSNFHIGQPSLLLLALMLGAFVALQRQREIVAGALIGLAAAIKAFPFVAIVYLLYRRHWLAAASLSLTLAVLLIVLPAPFRGFGQAKADLQRWSEGMLFKYDDAGVAQRPGRGNSWKNQSIFGVANRLLRHVDYDDRFAPHTPKYANIVSLPFTAVTGIILATALAFGLSYIGVMPRRSSRTVATDAIEFALLILLMLMFTPLSFGYLFACLLYPFTVIVQRWLTEPSRRLIACGAVAILLLLLTIPLQRPAQACGNTFFATMILFGGLALELRALTIAGARPHARQPQAI